MKLYLASANPGKLREFRAAALARGIEVEPVPGIQALPSGIEDGLTFAENARKKALHFSQYAPGPVLADDSGIWVEALSGAPGVHSARFAGPEASDEANNQKLLEELHRVESRGGRTSDQNDQSPAHARNRSAHYDCVIALAESGRLLTVVEGRVDGQIIDTPRGQGGFGYDPYFFYPPFGKTFAEISTEEKFTVSHRGEAFRKLLKFIEATRHVHSPKS